MKRLSVDLPESLHLALRQMLLTQGRTLSEWARAHAEEDTKGKKK